MPTEVIENLQMPNWVSDYYGTPWFVIQSVCRNMQK